ncbi:hypothetical protein H0H81_008509 [Sphagnurus paluster]|uniref:Uncharacterized protein n=1 Tax=Sphagnurus paluster TaxID=117069 RepID=A0A9P7KIB6_9AGAR|nr:hypothetical protein H0H81_008509 [Sphagnurus paluster]
MAIEILHGSDHASEAGAQNNLESTIIYGGVVEELSSATTSPSHLTEALEEEEEEALGEVEEVLEEEDMNDLTSVSALPDAVMLVRTVNDSNVFDYVDTNIEINIQDIGVKLTGSIDNLTLGPVTVSGFSKPNPFFEVEISSKKRGGDIGGQIQFLGLRTSLSCPFELIPSFIFKLDNELDFMELFQFKVHASRLPRKEEHKELEPAFSSELNTSLISSLASSLADSYLFEDYLLVVGFYSRGRKILSQQLDSLFQKLALEETEATATTQKAIDEERRQWEEKVNAAQAQLDEAHKAWEARHNQAHDNYAAKERETRADVDRLRAQLDEATRKIEEDISHAQSKLSTVQHDREVQINRDEENLRQTRKEWDEKLQDAHRALDDATRKVHSRFGYAQRDIDNAINSVNSLDEEISRTRRKISDCDEASRWDIPKKAAIPGFYVQIASLEASREVARGVLNFAKLVVQGNEFVTCAGAMRLAQESVKLAELGSYAAIETAVGALEVTKATTHKVVQLAELALEGAKRLGKDFLNLAQKALDAGEAVALEVMRGAQAIVDALESCAEKIEYETKRLALQTVKATGSGAIHLAKVGVAGRHEVAVMGRSVAHWVAEFFVKMIVITEAEFSLELGKAVGGFALDTYVKGSIKDEFELQTHFDPRSVDRWISSLFEK